MTRTCNRCGREKPIEAFATDRRRVYGKKGHCRECDRLEKRQRQAGIYVARPRGNPAWCSRPVVFHLSESEAARKFDKSKMGQDAAKKIALNWDRLARMDREGLDVLWEQASLGYWVDYTRDLCLRIIRAVEAERADAIRAMTLGMNKDVYQEALKKAGRDDV